MSYKRGKKTSQKQKCAHLIPSELIRDKRFVEIVNRVNDGDELTKRDRYIYGYSLLQTQRNLEALVQLWPLAAKEHAKLQEDCAIIAKHVFADEGLLCSAHLSDDALYTLFLVVKSLAPQSVAYYVIKQRLFDTLWQQGHFEKLERVLKSSKEEFPSILIENLSKLDFFQANRKLSGNIPAFVGHVLTGGGCLIARDSIYHGDIENALHLLANEIKYLFYQLKSKNKLPAWDLALFENFVDYEANILINVLQIVVKNSSVHFDIIPTPSYLMHYDATAKRVSEKFLPWLEAENKELFAAYSTNTYHAALWALGGEKTSDSNKALKSVHKTRVSPYLLLAIMLRSTNKKTVMPEKLVQLSDFENFAPTANVFKDVVIQTVKSMTNNHQVCTLSTEFWKILLEFYPMLQDRDCGGILVARVLEQLKEEYVDGDNLNVTKLKNIAHQTYSHDLAKQAEILCTRQQACMEFLLNLAGGKKSKKIINAIKDEAALRVHLTLIADCCLLAFAELSEQFFQHIKSVVSSKSLNKLIPLQELFDYKFECTCIGCKERLYKSEIPNIAKGLNLFIANVPGIHCCVPTQFLSKTQKSRATILSQVDPFKILGVSLADSKQEIMKKVMQLSQRSPGQMAIYRQAQSEIFNPAQRFLHHYLRFINCKNSTNDASGHQVLQMTTRPLREIPLRPEFLNEN